MYKKDVLQSRFPSEINCYFIELNHAANLRDNINKSEYSLFKYHVIDGKFENSIDTILKKHWDNSVFLYVDPYGIKAIDINKFNTFKLNKNKSVEMLINFNTWGFFREACSVMKVDYKMENNIQKYLVEYDPNEILTQLQLNQIAGGDYWIDIGTRYKRHELTAAVLVVIKDGKKYVIPHFFMPRDVLAKRMQEDSVLMISGLKMD